MDFEIEKGIPVPRNVRKGNYPYSEMEVGDSFFVSNEVASAEAVRNSASLYGRKFGKRFTVSLCSGGVRVWRLE